MRLPTNTLIPITIFAIAIFVHPAGATVTEYSSFAGWQSAAGSFTSLTFTETPGAVGTALTTEYSPWGVTFTAPHDVLIFSPGAFSLDGYGVASFGGPIELAFSQPMTTMAVHFIGGINQFQLFSQGSLIYTSDFFSGSGGTHFAGFVSNQSFDAAILSSVGFPIAFNMDNLYFGPPIPAPAALPLLAMVGIIGRRRR